MNKKAFAFLSVSVLVVALAVPSFAQTFRLTANVPFEFTVGGRTLPAGDYTISSDANPVVVRLLNTEAHAGVLALISRADVKVNEPAAPAKMVFNRYGDSYFLSEICDGYTPAAVRFPESRTERELAKTASIRTPEVVVLLALR